VAEHLDARGIVLDEPVLRDAVAGVEIAFHDAVPLRTLLRDDFNEKVRNAEDPVLDDVRVAYGDEDEVGLNDVARGKMDVEGGGVNLTQAAGTGEGSQDFKEIPDDALMSFSRSASG